MRTTTLFCAISLCFTVFGSNAQTCVRTSPYYESFDGPAFRVPTSYYDTGELDTCWQRSDTAGYYFEPKTGSVSFSFTGPTRDHTTGNGKYLFTTDKPGQMNSYTSFTTPFFDLSTLTMPEVGFWYHMYGSGIDSLILQANAGNGWAQIGFLHGQQQNLSTAPWFELVTSLSAYQNDTVQFRLIAKRINPYYNFTAIAIDDFRIDEKPSCPKPKNLVANNVLFSTTDLEWITGGASNWQIEYGPLGFAPGTGTRVSTSANPFTLTGLLPGTHNHIYVRDSCGLGDVSEWYGPIRIFTECNIASAPFFENFDGPTFQLPSNYGSPGKIDVCWRRSDSIGYHFQPGTGATLTANTGPNGDHTSGNGNYIFSRKLAAGLGNRSTWLLTPYIDLNAVNTPELRFWYHMYGSNIDTLVVAINNGSGWSRFPALVGQQQNSSSDYWLEYVQNLAAYQNDTVRIRITAKEKGSSNKEAEIAIDDFSVGGVPTCPKPQNIEVTFTSSTTVNVNWVSGGASNWQLEYGPPGFLPGTGTKVNVPSKPFTLKWLSPNTVYEIYVRDSCGATDKSAWQVPIKVRTDCSVFSAPFTENFDGPSFVTTTYQYLTGPTSIDPCWRRTDTIGYHFQPSTGSTFNNYSGPNGDHTSGNGKYLFSARDYSTYNTNRITSINSPLVDLGPLTNPELRFWYHMYGNNIDTLVVEAFDGMAWSRIGTIDGEQQNNSSAAWIQKVISLSAFKNDTLKIRFTGKRKNYSNSYNDISIDDFWIGDSTGCQTPINLAVLGQTSHSVQLHWVTGGASNWQIAYKPRFGNNGYTVANSASSTITIGGLIPGIEYIFKVRDSCAVGSVSLWGPELPATTLCQFRTVPYYENFDSPPFLPGNRFSNVGVEVGPCWLWNGTSTAPYFRTGTSNTGTSFTGPNADFVGNGNYLHIDYELLGGAAEIQTPEVYLPPGLQSPTLKFAYHMYGADIDSLKIEVNGGSGFQQVFSLIGQQQSSGSSPWKMDSVLLNSYLGDTIRVKFRGVASGHFGDISIDEVSITGTPNCSVPTSLSNTNQTPSALSVSWVSQNPPALSTLTYYSATAGSGTATVLTHVSSPQILTGLLPGTDYVVSITDSCGNLRSQAITDTFTTSACDSVAASLAFNTNFLVATFNSSATLGADSLVWNFGNGDTSHAPNPTLTFDSAGSYTVVFVAFNNCGQADTMSISLTVCDTLSAVISTQATQDTVIFTASGSTNALGYLWDFDDGFTSSKSDTTLIYGSTGIKNISLKTFNACGDTAIANKTLTLCVPPTARWTYDTLPQTGGGLKLQFRATASNASAYYWDFGDGQTGSGQNPVHTYATASFHYEVTLVVTNGCGTTDTLTSRLRYIGIEEWSTREDLRLFPNPANDAVTLLWRNGIPKIENITLINSLGQAIPIGIETSEKNKAIISLSGFAEGYYLLRIQTDQGLHTKRLIILH